jgi:spore maturation protein CgeB
VDRWLEQPWFEKYDLVTASSHKAAELLSLGSRFRPSVVPMATNLERFHPGQPNPLFESDYVFTGNDWGHGRDVIRFLDIDPDERFMLYGKGWDQDPSVNRYWRGHLPYDSLPEVYRSTKIVLDDTATPTLPYAFVNSRVFDAIASGALVLSDNVEGSEELFEGMLPTYSDSEGLRAHLDRFLGDEEQRVKLVETLRERVVERHSYATRPGEFHQLALDHLERPHAAIKIGVPNDDARPLWGDTHFAGGLASALTELGMPTEIHILPEWDTPGNQAVDVVIHLRGLTRYTPKPAHVNVLWIISHPDDVSLRECEQFDLVFVASRRHADWLRPQVEVPVIFLSQATDPRRFRPGGSLEEISTGVLFVGNSRGQRRPAVDWAIEAGLPITIYGGGWDNLIPSRFVRASHYPNRELARLYASAGVVLNDHWPDMREKGFISNRIFDALASGAVVVSDRVVGLDEMFHDLVPTYSDAEELDEVVRILLKDDERRLEISQSASRLVASQHTFSHRGSDIVAELRPLLNSRPANLEGRLLSL